jgi:hypothetical protein
MATIRCNVCRVAPAGSQIDCLAQITSFVCPPQPSLFSRKQVYETKQRFTDGRGHEAMSVQRGINDQAKSMVRERRGADEANAEYYRNVAPCA